MSTLQSFSASPPHLNSWVYSNTWNTKEITNLMLPRKLLELFQVQSFENVFLKIRVVPDSI